MSRWSDRRLVCRILAGDQQACTRLVRDHHAAIYRVLLHLCGDAHLAEDLTQETFAAAWQGLRGLSGSADLGDRTEGHGELSMRLCLVEAANTDEETSRVLGWRLDGFAASVTSNVDGPSSVP